MVTHALRRGLLVLALLLPQLAHADALGAVALGQALGDVLSLIAVLFLGLLVVAYRRDAPAALLLLLGMSYFFGLFPTREWLLFGRFNPYFCFCIPLGAWLYGALNARRARREFLQLVWLGVAIIALRQVPELGTEWALFRTVAPGTKHLAGLRAVYILLKIVLGVGSWWVVLRQLRLTGDGTWWQPWWRAPAVVAGVGAICWGGFEVMRFQEISSPNVFIYWPRIGWGMLEDGALGLVTGALALWLISPPTTTHTAADTINSGQ